jgi:hypothetical protein
MKTRSTLSLLFLFLLITSLTAYSQTSGFSGDWKLNTEKTVLEPGQLFLSKVTVLVKGDSLLTTRVYEDGNGSEYPFEENLSLDGKEGKITIYDMPRTSRVLKSAADGSFTIESTTIFNGQNGEDSLTAKETWKVDKEGKLLTVEFTNTMSGVEIKGTNYYNRIK